MSITSIHTKDSRLLIQAIEKWHNYAKEDARKKRFASYDFCYEYFQRNRKELLNDVENACMHLWSYLASWGMLRGSSELLQKSPAALEPLVVKISKTPDYLWDMDICDFSQDKNIELFLLFYRDFTSELKKILPSASTTLATKILLGVYGIIPAYDTYFTMTFRNEFKNDSGCAFRAVNRKSIQNIYDFYLANKHVFDSIVYPVIDFNGEPTNLKYKRAKLIDMYGFSINSIKQ